MKSFGENVDEMLKDIKPGMIYNMTRYIPGRGEISIRVATERASDKEA